LENARKKIVQTGDNSACSTTHLAVFAKAWSAHLHTMIGKSGTKVVQKVLKQDALFVFEELTKKITGKP